MPIAWKLAGSTVEDAHEPAPVAPAARNLLFVAAGLVFLAGVQLYVFTLRTDEYFAWTIASPMTAVFLGAAYWSAVGLEVAAARAENWEGARIALPTAFVFTATTFVVTLIHLDLFHLDSDLAFKTRLVTWLWLAVYGGVPVMMVVAFFQQRRVGLATAPPGGLPGLVRGVLVVLAAVLLGFGLCLLIAPSWADGAWPWALTPLTARAIGAWLLGLGVAAADSRRLDDASALRPLGATGALFGLFQGIALLRHGDELAWDELSSYGYVLFLVLLTSVSVWSLLETGGLWADRSPRVRRET